jgi:hypothetical protein
VTAALDADAESRYAEAVARRDAIGAGMLF